MTTPEQTTGEPAGLRLGPLARWLASVGAPIDAVGPLSARLLPGGRSNVTYRLTDVHGSSVVVRRPPLGHILPSAHDMSREFRVLHGLGQVGFPVPEAIAECTDTEIIGAPFLVMAYVDGRVIDSQPAAEELSPAEADGVCAALADTLADLHEVDAGAAGLTDLGRPEGYVERQVRRWSQQWELTKVEELADIDRLRTWLAEAVTRLPADLPWSVVHGDYRLDNVIVARDDPRIEAVLDWEMSTLGDPVVDLAVALVYWSQHGDGLRATVPVAEHMTDGPGFWSRAQLIDRYAARSGRSIDHLDVAVALACFKLAVIMESIRYRALSGQQLGAAAGTGDALGVATRSLAALGLAVTREGTLAGLAH